jgi:hypothetical protein
VVKSFSKAKRQTSKGLPSLKLQNTPEKLFRADCPHALRQAGLVAGGGVLVDHALLDGLVEGRYGFAAAPLSPLAMISRSSRNDPRSCDVLLRLVAVRFEV